MIKKFGVAVLIAMAMISLYARNKDMWDTNYTFDAAICYSDFDGDGVGEWKTFEINNWTDYSDGDSIQIKTKDGDVYLFHASNCTLINRD
jgi:hypothetical protein